MQQPELFLFLSTFFVVFCYGLQSQFVNSGHYKSAFANSFAISACNLMLYKLAPHATSATEISAYLIGGPIAIVLSMFVFRKLLKTKNTTPTS
jgi:hypothetical protein